MNLNDVKLFEVNVSKWACCYYTAKNIKDWYSLIVKLELDYVFGQNDIVDSVSDTFPLDWSRVQHKRLENACSLAYLILFPLVLHFYLLARTIEWSMQVMCTVNFDLCSMSDVLGVSLMLLLKASWWIFENYLY